MRSVRVAVVGDVEWVQFVGVERVAAAGAVVQANEAWEEPAGAGAVAAVQLARLAGSCTFFTALGDDELGRRSYEELARLGVRVEAAFRQQPQRRAVTFIDAEGERTITLIGEKLRPRRAEPLPWDELGDYDAAYFTGGDADALRAARAARVLVAYARELPTLKAAGVRLDVLLGSASDPGERYAEELDPPPDLVVRTAGSAGGTYEPGASWAVAALPGPREDAYGAGDSFAAGLTFALAESRPVPEALAFAARCGAEALTRRGAHGLTRPPRTRPGV